MTERRYGFRPVLPTYPPTGRVTSIRWLDPWGVHAFYKEPDSPSTVEQAIVNWAWRYQKSEDEKRATLASIILRDEGLLPN